MAAAERIDRMMSLTLLVGAANVALVGIVVVFGGAALESDVRRLAIVAGLALLGIAALCGWAGLLVRRGHPWTVPSATAGTVALAALAGFRLWRFGAVDIASVLPLALAAMLVRNRLAAPPA